MPHPLAAEVLANLTMGLDRLKALVAGSHTGLKLYLKYVSFPELEKLFSPNHVGGLTIAVPESAEEKCQAEQFILHSTDTELETFLGLPESLLTEPLTNTAASGGEE